MTRCERCKRPLTARRSVRNGLGDRCRKIRREEAAVRDVRPHIVQRGLELISVGGLQPVNKRRKIFRTVGSTGTQYVTTPRGCNCAAGMRPKHVMCHHRAAVLMQTA